MVMNALFPVFPPPHQAADRGRKDPFFCCSPMEARFYKVQSYTVCGQQKTWILIIGEGTRSFPAMKQKGIWKILSHLWKRVEEWEGRKKICYPPASSGINGLNQMVPMAAQGTGQRAIAKVIRIQMIQIVADNIETSQKHFDTSQNVQMAHYLLSHLAWQQAGF